MKIAIIGSGISGLTCGWLLHKQHDVRIFEANSWIGGHTNTVDFELSGREYSVDTGFIVCNDRTYPNFLQLIDHLGVRRNPTEMSFSVRCDTSGVEYSGSTLRGVFIQPTNLFRPSFLKMMADIFRFNREGTRDADRVSTEMTVGEYLDENRYSSGFCDRYLLPMGAAIWSCPTGTFRDFPIRFILEFYRHHGLLSITNRPQWYVIDGGSQRYVEKLTAGFRDRIQLNCPVQSVVRSEHSVTIHTADGPAEFDEVIFACHSDQALRLLDQPTERERDMLGAFPYGANEAVLHTDISVLPKRRGAWASWNYRIRPDVSDLATLTYNMNILQHVDCPETICVSLNDVDQINPARVIGRYRYEHPIFSVRRHQVQQSHGDVIRRHRTSFCGAYWGNGFHEDGVTSALAVCRRYGAQDVLDQQLSDADAQTPSLAEVR
ncbi:MAG: FAD-dependent oxidoreductase [Planctomycetaceae bacterium]|nr:FAD-dependent oxidoreductase [Planctomycetaceae bacterium]